MVPDKFNMVDMEGIDIITSQGEAVEGLYQKLVESIALCRYQCLYNWKFDGILISPTYVEMDIVDNVVWINEGVSVDENDVIRIYSLDPPAPEPQLTELTVIANGNYLPPAGYDGFSSVEVEVPSVEPVLSSLSVTSNGTYTPPTGVDGYNEVAVNVPSSQPVLSSLSVISNGTYTPPAGTDGYNEVVVNVPSVSIPQLQFHLGRLTINTGEIVESNEYCYSDLIPVSTGTGQWFIDLSRIELSSYYIGICFYESDGQTQTGYIRQYQAFRSYTSNGIDAARYMRLATKVSYLSFAAVAFANDNLYLIGSQSTIKKANL